MKKMLLTFGVIIALVGCDVKKSEPNKNGLVSYQAKVALIENMLDTFLPIVDLAEKADNGDKQAEELFRKDTIEWQRAALEVVSKEKYQKYLEKFGKKNEYKELLRLVQ